MITLGSGITLDFELKILIIALAAVLLFIGSARCQEFKHYDLVDGLSGIEVTDIKENDNFLWIATTDGLNRFDGRNFKIYKRSRDNQNSLSGNNIEVLFFDSGGLLWIGLNTGGLNVYDPRKDRFYNLQDLIDIQGPNRVISVFEDSRKNVWLGTWEEGLYQLIPKGAGKMGFSAKIHYPGYIVSTLTEKPKGFLRVGTYYGLFVYDMTTGEWTDLGNQEKAITQFAESAEENSIWCSTWGSGLLKLTWESFDPAGLKLDEYLSMDGSGPVFRILNDGSNSLYLGTWGNGLVKLLLFGKKETERIRFGSMAPSFINCLYRDRFNNVWIGTFGEGLFKLFPEKRGLAHFPLTGKLPKPAVSMVNYSGSQVLVGTQGAGIYLFDAETKLLAPGFEGAFTGSFDSNILSLQADDDYLFIGHDGQGIRYIRRQDKELKLMDIAVEPQLAKITAVYRDQQGTTWIGTKQNGLVSFKINPVTNRPENYSFYPDFGHDAITGIIPWNKDKLLISTNIGLFLFNSLTKKIEQNGIILNDPVYRILKDNKNNCLWIGTSENLLQLDLQAIDSLAMPFPEGLMPHGAVRTLVLDRQNNLWFSIGQSLFCRTQDDNSLHEINPDMTGPHTLLCGAPVMVNGTENLVFGTSEDLMVIEPDWILQQPDQTRVIFIGLEIDHKPVHVGEELHREITLKEATEYESSLRLSHKCKWISLSFAETGPDYFKKRYQFRINGFSDSWQLIDLNNPVTFSQLLPGSYVLEIRQFNQNSDKPADWTIDMSISPPWWKTGLFKFLAAITLVMTMTLIALFLDQRIKRKHAQKLRLIKKEKQDELLREKESFFSGLSHDLLTTFSLILAPVNDLIRENKLSGSGREKLEIIRKNTSFLSDMFGTIFDFKRAEFTDTQIREDNIEIVSVARLVVNAFEYLASSRNIKLNFKTDVDALNVVADHVKLERILYNLLSNAIKFAPDSGEVSLELHSGSSAGMVTFIVRDNGMDIDIRDQDRIFEKFYQVKEMTRRAGPGGLGLGLFIVKKFVSLIGGTVSVISSKNEGTAVTVNIPVKPAEIDSPTEDPNLPQPFSEERSTILIVEDNEQMLEYLAEKLKSFFNVIRASDGLEALKLIEYYLPEMIITDLVIPGLDGLALTRKIKTDNKLADIFVVILSARSSFEDELEGYKQGADIYLKKPIDLEVLLNQMINIHTTRQKRKNQLYADLVSQNNRNIEFDARESFLKWSMQIIEDHLTDAEFNLDDFAAEMNISKSVLHRKFKLLVGQTPNQLIRIVRLRRSVELIRNSDLSITEIAYMSGFNQAHYFIKCFKEVYKETPKTFRSNLAKSPPA